MMTQPMRIWMVMALALILMLAGCAGETSDSPDVSQAATPTAESTATTSSGELGELNPYVHVTENTFPLPDNARDVQVYCTGMSCSVHYYPATWVPRSACLRYCTGMSCSVHYDTLLSFQELTDFYREQLTTDGAVERLFVAVTDMGFPKLVFDGWDYAGSRAVVIDISPPTGMGYAVRVYLADI